MMMTSSNETPAQVRSGIHALAYTTNAIRLAPSDKQALALVPTVTASIWALNDRRVTAPALRCDEIAEPGRRAQGSPAHYIALARVPESETMVTGMARSCC